MGKKNNKNKKNCCSNKVRTDHKTVLHPQGADLVVSMVVNDHGVDEVPGVGEARERDPKLK